jgi:hypothetical protein
MGHPDCGFADENEKQILREAQDDNPKKVGATTGEKQILREAQDDNPENWCGCGREADPSRSSG